MELKEVSLAQLKDEKIIPLRGHALQYFRNLQNAKDHILADGKTRYQHLTTPESFCAETAVIFSHEGNYLRDDVYDQLMFHAEYDIVVASKYLYGLTYDLIDFIGLGEPEKTDLSIPEK